MKKILKFGGSSLANHNRIKKACEIILSQHKNHNICVVVSAMEGVTNQLKELSEISSLGNDFSNQLKTLYRKNSKCVKGLELDQNKKLMKNLNLIFDQIKNDLSVINNAKICSVEMFDKILSYGELLSSALLEAYLQSKKYNAIKYNSSNFIITDEDYGNAYVHFQSSFDAIRMHLKNIEIQIPIITGFIGSTKSNKITTLGRSGSDYTASILGAALNVDIIEIWTDVNGILTADPNLVENPNSIPELTYEEAMELAHAGARVIFPPTMIPALYKSIDIVIKNSFNPKFEGSRIKHKRKLSKNSPIIGLSSISGKTLIRLQGPGMVGLKGIVSRIFACLSKNDINIILISQAFSEHSVCFAISAEHNKTALKALKLEFSYEISNHFIDKIILEEKLTIIAVVGEGMKQTPGIANQVFDNLGINNINVIAIAQGSSERNISFIIDDHDSKFAINLLHSNFFSPKTEIPNLFILGAGKIGSELLRIISKYKHDSLNINIIAKSKEMVINPPKNLLNNESKLFEKSVPTDTNYILNYNISKSNKKNIIVDCTSDQKLAMRYNDFFDKGFSIVTASKIANTLSQDYFELLRGTSLKNKTSFHYETNVGAGLPIISTLKGMISSGDKILKIQGIMSGTLSYIFSKFNKSIKFSELVKKAKEKGFTEPDPRDDLSGLDVARKMLILIRETGTKIELSDIKIENLVPKEIEPTLSINEFFIQFSEYDKLFLDKYLKGIKKNQVLRYIGSWDGNKAEVNLDYVDNSSPFYYQKGRENFIILKSNRYNESPLIVRGHGAGAEVTAAGVLQDIEKI